MVEMNQQVANNLQRIITGLETDEPADASTPGPADEH
jgi:hypothetical protein